jgi:hypothetical protein
MYCAHMLNHAQRRHKTGKRRVGVAVNKTFKVEAYLESRELIALIDKARAIRKEATGLRQSRSAFIGLAAVNEARRVLAEVGK